MYRRISDVTGGVPYKPMSLKPRSLMIWLTVKN